MTKKKTHKDEESARDGLWRALKRAKTRMSYPKVAKEFGMSYGKVRWQLSQGLPSKRKRSVDPQSVKKCSLRAALVAELGDKLCTHTTYINKKKCTQKFSKYETCKQIANMVAVKLKTKPPSAQTIRRDLIKAGFECTIVQESALITNDAKRHRRFWAKKLLKSNDHKNIFFSDESSADRNPRGRRFQWVKKGSKIRSYLGISSSGPRVMYWGMIGLGYKSDLVFLPCKSGKKKTADDDTTTTHTARSYRRLCITKKTAQAVGDGSFMHDNSPIHKANIIKDKLAALKMKVLPNWPPYSPDLNPIEQLWGILKRKIQRHNNLHTVEGLTGALRTEWAKISQETIDKMMISFPRRLQACVDRKGERVPSRLPKK